MKVAVIGSGIAGLSAALNLASMGVKVTVFEKNSWVGGKINQFEINCYRFDKGPSLFTLPKLVDELFHLFDKNPRDYYSYKKLPEACRYFDYDGKSLIAYGNSQDFLKEVEEKLSESYSLRVKKYLKNSSANYQLSIPLFIQNDKGLLTIEGIKMMLKAKQMGIFTTLNQFNNKHLEDPFLIKIFNRFATYNGSNPYLTPAVLNCIPALEHDEGSYFPSDGIYGIVAALHQLALEVGIEFLMDTEINKIEEEDSNGWRVNDLYSFDKVVINGDYFTTQKILPQKYRTPLPKKDKLSTSGLVFYWGINKSFPDLGVHNIFFAKDYEEEFKKLAQFKIGTDLTVYIHISSKVQKSDAPENCENWFVMVNVPPQKLSLEEQNSIRKSVIQKLNAQLNSNIEDLIETEEVFNPQLIQQDTSGYSGALYGYHSNSLGMMMKRPKNKSKINGIYYAGGTVFPGGGIPLCVSSGKLAAEKLINS